MANVILQEKDFSLEWVFKRRHNLKQDNVPDLLDIESNDPGTIYSAEDISMDQVLDQHPVDYVIDFSSSDGIYSYGKKAARQGIKVISAISHYSSKEQDFLKELSKLTTVFWSPNITIGVNFLLIASKLLQKIAPLADIELLEEHFKEKEGVSGTAIKIAAALDIDEKEINSIRAGGIIGKHEVIFGFPYQTVRLVHESISREAFGSGAIFVAKNIKNKGKGLYNFEDILLPYFNLSSG